VGKNGNHQIEIYSGNTTYQGVESLSTRRKKIAYLYNGRSKIMKANNTFNHEILKYTITMKKIILILVICFLWIVSCKKESHNTSPNLYCGNTGKIGPVKYYLTPFDKSLFTSYALNHSLSFVDSTTNDTVYISYSSDGQVWDETSAQSQIQGDTVDIGERAGIAYNYGTMGIGNLEYHFNAFPNRIDSINIIIGCGHVGIWKLNLKDTNKISTTGYTPFSVLNTITFLSHTFSNVYFLQRGSSLCPTDSSNNCYYTKADGIIAFTDKRNGKFWLRTNY